MVYESDGDVDGYLIPDISDQLLTLPYHGVVKECRTDLAEHLADKEDGDIYG